MQKESSERATVILREDQKQAWKDLVSQHLKVQFQFRGSPNTRSPRI